MLVTRLETVSVCLATLELSVINVISDTAATQPVSPVPAPWLAHWELSAVVTVTARDTSRARGATGARLDTLLCWEPTLRAALSASVTASPLLVSQRTWG